MFKVLWLVLSLLIVADARENPFVSFSATKNVTTHITEERADFNGTIHTLPSSARILKSVTLTFQNLDGSIGEDVVGVEQNVDWHKPIVVEYKKSAEESLPLPPVAKKESIKSVKQEPEKIVQSTPKLQQEAKVENFQLNDKISFTLGENEIRLFNKDIKIRDFLVTNPYKIVLDFKKDGVFSTKTISFQKAPFVSATMGDHDGFYRIAILLDGQYRYALEAFDGGYVIRLK